MISDAELDQYASAAEAAIAKQGISESTVAISRLILALTMEIKAARGEIRRMRAIVREAKATAPKKRTPRKKAEPEGEPKKRTPRKKKSAAE